MDTGDFLASEILLADAGPAFGRRSPLREWVTHRLATGRLAFSRKEAMRGTGIGHGAFLDAAERLQRRRHLISPRRGFYVIVPPRFTPWGAPPPSWYIDDLMRFERCPYYVGLLKAGELHGAAHQAAMEFQVITDKRLPRIKAGRTALAFYYRKHMAGLGQGIEKRKTGTGVMRVSSPGLTALDMLRYPHAAAGLDHAATMLGELGDRIDGKALATLSAAFERPVVQRLGYLLDRLGFAEQAQALHASLAKRAAHWTELEPAEAHAPELVPEPLERNRKWRVVARRMPEPD